MPIRIFNRERSISVNILQDTSLIQAIVPMKRNLECYFATALYRDMLKSLE